jgi:hypothetical protein
MKISIAARTLKTRADLTIKPDPLLLDLLPVKACWNPEVMTAYKILFFLRIYAVKTTLKMHDVNIDMNGKGCDANSGSHGIGKFCPKKQPIRSGIVSTIVAAARTFIISFMLLDMIEA